MDRLLLSSFLCLALCSTQAQSILTDSLPTKDTTRPKWTATQDSFSSQILDILPTISINDNSLYSDDEENAISSLLSASRDPFLSAASFNFNAMHFHIRGYDNGWNKTYINGLPFNGLDNGYTPYGLWRSLSTMMRNKENVQGLQANSFDMGFVGINTNVDMRAGSQWAETNITYATANRSYRHRIRLTHSSGFNQKGWAYSLAAVAQFSNEGYAPGTYDNSFSFYAAIDKRLNLKNTLSFISFYAPSEYGRQAATVQETRQLTGNNFYNPSWGYQKGQKRNANVLKARQPVFILSHEYKPSNNSRLLSSVGYFFGTRSKSALDWYNAPNPKPDYYRYLPSYYAQSSPSQAAALTKLIQDNPDLLQINWQHLYDVNQTATSTIQDVNGIEGNNVTGHRSNYILSNRVVYTQHLMASSVFNARMGKYITITAGANYAWQDNHYYQQVADLLGGNFWVNINQYAARDFPTDKQAIQYDVEKPNQLKVQGNHYGYDYNFTFSKLAGWFQTKINLNHFDLFWASEIARTQFSRTGNKRNGLFPQDSKGNTGKQHFINHSNKVGITYKLDGRNYFYVNAGYLTQAPKAEAAYISPRMRNTLQAHLENEVIQSIEGGYRLNTPSTKIHLNGFFTRSQHGFDILSFYDDSYQNFVNYALSNIDKLYFGGELGADIKLTPTLALNAAASIGRYYYDSRQKALVTADNSAKVLANKTVYIKNYRIPSTPQNAYSLGLFYRSPKKWFLGLSGNYMNNMWLSINPIRHTADAFVDVSTQQMPNEYAHILAQEKIPGQFMLDLFTGWRKKLKHTYINKQPVYLVFSLGINNLTNNDNIISGGYEQLRFDINNFDVDKFPPKYYYSYGLNYYLSATLRF